MTLPLPLRQSIAEFLGTFCLVFAGTGAIIVNDISGGAISHVGIAATFGLVVMVMIYSIGDLSGAHLNPAVSLGFFAAGKSSVSQLWRYLVSQFMGALSASLILRLTFPTHGSLGATLPSHGIFAAFLFEVILTFILMFVIINVATGGKEKGIMAGLAIGATVGLDALFGGPVSGASMNPARSFAPALISGHLEGSWMYFIAPTIGALAAIGTWRLISNQDS